jgi:hypothetical protein
MNTQVTISVSIFGVEGKKYLIENRECSKEAISDDWWIPMCCELIKTADDTAYLKFECNGRLIEKKSYTDVIKYMNGDDKRDCDPDVIKYICPLIREDLWEV